MIVVAVALFGLVCGSAGFVWGVLACTGAASLEGLERGERVDLQDL